MVTVGVLAMIVNVSVLVTVSCADRAIELIVRNFATSRLHRTKRAPVVHDSDTWLPNIPRSIVKYYRHPAILAAVLCTVLLLASELVSELGVELSEKCSPVSKNGVVINEGNRTDTPALTSVELGAAAFFLQTITFLDGPLTRVTKGMPKSITGKECLLCLYKDKDKHPDIVCDCLVKKKKVYQAGELKVGVKTTDHDFGTIAVGFHETRGNRTKFTGEGDLTDNGQKKAIFLFAYERPDNADKRGNSTTTEMLYFEYGYQEHVNLIFEESKEAEGHQIWRDTKSRVHVWSIVCDLKHFSPEQFQLAVMTYRSIQLENPTKIISFNRTEERFEPISTEDVYRAVLSMKVIDNNNETRGEYYEYTTCAQYKWQFLAPLVVCVALILILGFWSSVLSSKYKEGAIPHNSRSWFRQCQRVAGGRRSSNEPSRSGYFDTLYEEMVLVDGGGTNEQRILFRPRSSRSAKLPDVDASLGYSETTEEIFEGLEPRGDG